MTLPAFPLDREAVARWSLGVLRDATASLPQGAHSGLVFPHKAFSVLNDAILALVAEAVRRENEECAKECDDEADVLDGPDGTTLPNQAMRLAAAIRARRTP